jgi:rod shape determining protein RodA
MRDLGGHRGRGLTQTIDWKLVICYLLLILIGWANIYAAVQADEPSSIFDWGCRSGKQFVWILTSLGLGGFILFVLNPRIYEGLSLPIYMLTLGLLVAVIFLGIEVKGSRSWFEFGPVRFQPAEISKISTSLLLATVMSQLGYKINRMRDFLITAAIILVPMAIIILESETGLALVYVGFIFMLYREGLSGWLIFLLGMAILTFVLTMSTSVFTTILVLLAITSFCIFLYSGWFKAWFIFCLPVVILLAFVPSILDALSTTVIPAAEGSEELATEVLHPFWSKIKPTYILGGILGVLVPLAGFFSFKNNNKFAQLAIIAFIAGIILIFSTDFIFNNVLQWHQRTRIEVLLGLKDDPTGIGYNVNQSKIAIASGGMFGKGYLNGTQTTYGFVPEQSTDFIFCTIGEEWGFMGCATIILIYIFLIWRIIHNAENSREGFTRIYGYCVACCIFMHLFINIGMTIGLMPVIGIPLPFLSYGGSSMWGFTAMLFIFIALYRNEKKYF